MPEYTSQNKVLPEDHHLVKMLGHKPGCYRVYVGDFGWDDGDLYIVTNVGKVKLKDI